MADLSKPKPSGQELSHIGNANKAIITSGGTQKPNGQELGTIKNANLAV